jgi:hypothetical protein
MLKKLLRHIFAPLPDTAQKAPPAFCGDAIDDAGLPPVHEDYQAHVVDVRSGTMTLYSAAGSVYEKSLSSPWWAAAAKLERGTFARYGSVGREWHIFIVVEGPLYGRRDHQNVGGGLSVVAQRVSTREVFTMPADALEACAASFASRDGTPIRRGESEHWTANRGRGSS